MKDTSLNLELLRVFNIIESLALRLTALLHDISDHEKSVCAIKLPLEGKHYTLLERSEHGQVMEVFCQFKAKLEQDPSRPYRLPGVIQISRNHENEIALLVKEINDQKAEFESLIKKMTKGLDARSKAKRIHNALGSNAYITLQVVRKICCISDALNYIGITYHKKPNVALLTKQDVLNRLSAMYDRPKAEMPVNQWNDFINGRREAIELLDEADYSFRVTRGSYYRPMLNVRYENGKVAQPSASIPVIVFTDTFIPVSFPRFNDNEKQRSDLVFDQSSPDLSFADIHISSNT